MRHTDDITQDALIALNGDLIGALVEFDTEAGYVVQRQPDGSLVRKEGVVELVGSSLVSNPHGVRMKLNRTRHNLGLAPLPSEVQYPLQGDPVAKAKTITDVQRYIEVVRTALYDVTGRRLSKRQYMEALEEIATDVDGMLEAVRAELKE